MSSQNPTTQSPGNDDQKTTPLLGTSEQTTAPMEPTAISTPLLDSLRRKVILTLNTAPLKSTDETKEDGHSKTTSTPDEKSTRIQEIIQAEKAEATRKAIQDTLQSQQNILEFAITHAARNKDELLVELESQVNSKDYFELLKEATSVDQKNEPNTPLSKAFRWRRLYRRDNSVYLNMFPGSPLDSRPMKGVNGNFEGSPLVKILKTKIVNFLLEQGSIQQLSEALGEDRENLTLNRFLTYTGFSATPYCCLCFWKPSIEQQLQVKLDELENPTPQATETVSFVQQQKTNDYGTTARSNPYLMSNDSDDDETVSTKKKPKKKYKTSKASMKHSLLGDDGDSINTTLSINDIDLGDMAGTNNRSPSVHSEPNYNYEFIK